MRETNLFTLLSAYRPGSAATPFENYCTSGLAYFLSRGQRMLTALFAEASGAGRESLALVEVQAPLADAGVADMVLTFEGGRRAIVEVQVEAGADESALPLLTQVGDGLTDEPAFVLVGLGDGAPGPWVPTSWLRVVEALEDDPDPMAQQFSEFILRDVLGLGAVALDQAIATNRLYALGAAAVRRKFGERASYVNSASRPVGGKYRYLGTTFGLDDNEKRYWVGIVNEQLPLSDHYHLMLASKEAPVRQPSEHPRATGDWKWANWTGLGRVVRPIEAGQYEELLGRIEEG
ncbi:MAG: hypothetical protein ACRDHF_06575 [Tepidiformaceae bacterium]